MGRDGAMGDYSRGDLCVDAIRDDAVLEAGIVVLHHVLLVY